MADVVVKGDTSGAVTLSAPAVAGTVTVTLPSTSGTMAVLPTATGVLTEAAGGTGTTTGYYGFKSRIINGGMTIDQRNAGASVTPAASAYTLDRWFANLSAASKFSVAQSTVAPAGFTNSVLITSTSAYSIVAGDYNTFQQRIEANNMMDAGWGTANAQTFTLSFWVRSSLTGTFGGSLYFPATTTRTFPFSYVINSANTWEQKTITITGDTTSNTAPTTNNLYVIVQWGLGVGSTYTTATTGWQNGNFASPTGCTNLIATNTANLYITGVQLEKGSTATSFDYRPYGTELALCYRYYRKYYGSNGGYTAFGSGISVSAVSITRWGFMLDVPMRATPTPSFSGAVGYNGVVGGNITVGTNFSSTNYIDADLTTSGLTATTGLAGKVLVAGTTGFIELTGAEL